MILAQRAPIAASYDYSAFTTEGEPRVLRYWLENPRKPENRSRWIAEPEEYAVGFAGDYRNTNGGVALGYGYGPGGALDTKSCEAALWTTGQDLRNDPALQQQLSPGGPLVVHGLQALPAAPVRPFNQPPWTSYSVDYDSAFHDPAATGRLGQVRIPTAPCAEGQYGGPGSVATAAAPVVGGGGGGPPPPPPPPPNACFTGAGTFSCVDFEWVYALTVAGPGWIDAVSAVSLTPGVIVPGGPFPLNPANIPVTGAPGSIAVIEVCAFNAAAAASGKPYDCCHATLRVTIPNRSCGISLK